MAWSIRAFCARARGHHLLTEGVVAASLLVFMLALGGCGNSSSDMTFQQAFDRIRSVALRKGSESDARGAVVLKSDFLEAFGQPMRAQQDGDKLILHYPIKDGMLLIEARARYWNGAEQYEYLEPCMPSVLPDDPLIVRLGVSRSVHTIGASVPEEEKALVNWYAKSHKNPYTIHEVEITSRGKHYCLHENGKYIYTGGAVDSRDKAEQLIKQLLAHEAANILRQKNDEFQKRWRERYVKEHTKIITEPCVVVCDRMKVY